MDDTTTYADEHENGQLRIAVPGEQVSLLPLPDSLIPSAKQIRGLADEELQPFVDEIMRFSEPTRKVIAREANKRAQARRQSFDEFDA